MTKKTTKMNRTKALAVLGLSVAIAYTTPSVVSLDQAHASGGGGGGFGGIFGGFFGPEGGGGSAFAPRDSITANECSDCHQAYDPGLMPQGSWIQLLSDLPNHFGEDASLDAETQDHITQYMMKNSARGNGPIRITEQRWFKGEHWGGNDLFKCDSCHR
jgi:hypothetical protein